MEKSVVLGIDIYPLLNIQCFIKTIQRLLQLHEIEVCLSHSMKSFCDRLRFNMICNILDRLEHSTLFSKCNETKTSLEHDYGIIYFSIYAEMIGYLSIRSGLPQT